jgi:hypothetical protein
MRRRSLFVVLVCTGLAMAGCTDQSPTSLPNQMELQPAEVAALLSSNPSILDLRMQSDELLREPARTFARYALAKVQFDINYQRPTLYASSLVFAAIPLVERRLNRIPEEKVGKLIDLLCTLQQLIGPKLPPTSRLNMIPWCQLNPEELGNEAEFKLISNSTGGTVETNTEQLSLTIAANTMRDAAGNPVSSALFTVLPLERRAAGSEDDHPCPQPFNGDFANDDCYPEFYELTSRPLVQFVGTKAILQVCQLDPHAESSDAPSEGVLARLRLFVRSATGAVALLPKFVDGEENPPAVNTLACDGDEDLGHTAIGPIDFSKDGLRNAWLAMGRVGARALGALGPRTLYALNVPTHGRIDRELIDFAGTVVGGIDVVGSDPEPSNTLVNGDFEAELTSGWTERTTTGNASITRVTNGEGFAARLAGNTGPMDEDCAFNSITNNFAALGQSFTLSKNQVVQLDVLVPAPAVDESERVCATFERVELDFIIEGATPEPANWQAVGVLTIDFTQAAGVTGFLQVNDNVNDAVSSTTFDPDGFDAPVSTGGLTISHSPVGGWYRVSFEVSDTRFPWLTDNVNFRIMLRNEDHKTGREFTLTADDVTVQPIVIIP